MGVTKKIVMHFPSSLVDQPIMYRLVKEFNLEFNILKASVTPKEEGLLVVQLTGSNDDFKKSEKYLSEIGVKIQPLSRDVVRLQDKCIHCGACIVICPSDALNVDRTTMKVDFDDTKCIACEMCVPACPSRAMEIRF